MVRQSRHKMTVLHRCFGASKKLQKEPLGPQLEKSLGEWWWDWEIKVIGFEA